MYIRSGVTRLGGNEVNGPVSVYEVDAMELSGELDGDDEKRYALHDVPKTRP